MRIVAVIVAGGNSSRMGGHDKASLDLGGRPVIGWIIGRLAPQVTHLAINANDDRFASLGLPMIPDLRQDIGTPLAGVHAGLTWAKTNGFEAVLTVPSDSPFLPPDLLVRLAGQRPAIAASAGQSHFLTGFWPVKLLAVLDSLPLRRVQDFAQQVSATVVHWPTEPFDPFFNVNSPEDLAEASRIAAEFSP